MKILSNKEYSRLVELEVFYKEKVEKIAELKKELEEAKNLKSILEKLYPLWSLTNNLCYTDSIGTATLNLPNDVLRYVDDILGGKVIKQEGVKCLVIDTDGNVKTGLTKQKADKGFKYKLVRN